MDRQSGMQPHIAPSLLIALLIVVSPALAQQQECRQPAPAPSNPQTTDTKDGKDDKDRQRGTVGKSKLEKDTGTVNDRIFEVLPNYGTVENAKELPPLTTGQKFRLATAGVFDWGAYPFNGILSGIAQAKNDPKEWGQGWDAYGKRYGASFADNSIGTYMTTAIFPSLLQEDPRYYQLGNGRFAHRAYHAITGSLSFGPIQDTNASTSRNRLAMQWQRRSPMPTMFRRIARPLETSLHLPF
jgi:hypothetical protein